MFVSKQTIEDVLEQYRTDQAFQAAVASIEPGKIKRDPNNPQYQKRVQYTVALRDFVYNPALLNVIFGDAELKANFLRIFGYRGNTNFTIYPNCWLRDLPLLDIGAGVYLGDHILLGTNQVSPNQEFLTVGTIQIGDNSIFDQQCSIGLNAKVGSNVQGRFKSSIGLKATVHNNVLLGEGSNIGHGTVAKEGVILERCAGVGNFCIIDAGVVVPEYATIPSFSHVTESGIVPRQQSKKRFKAPSQDQHQASTNAEQLDSIG